MILVENKKAKEIAEKFSKLYGEVIQVRFGAPDAASDDGYYVYARTWKGYQATGTYGHLLATATTLKGLLFIANDKLKRKEV